MPIGFAPNPNSFANASFTIATRGDCAVSRSLKSRPATIGMRSVSKYPGLTELKFESLRCVESWPSTHTELPQP